MSQKPSNSNSDKKNSKRKRNTHPRNRPASSQNKPNSEQKGKPRRKKKDQTDTKQKSFSQNTPKNRNNRRKKTNEANKNPRQNNQTRRQNPRAKVKEERSQKDTLIRLNKYIADAGICSRREADELISAGKITVNGKVITELGYKIKASDSVKYGKAELRQEKPVYILLNKPKDYITTTDDPQERKIVMDLVRNACEERIYPVGRLDRDTTGLLLFTNDGELAQKLSHPSYEVSKIYQVDLNKPIQEEDYQKLVEGVLLSDGIALLDKVAILNPEKTSIGVELHLGRNRIIRRIFEHLGYEVIKLDRTMYAGLTKKDLSRGKWRTLTDKEIIRIKYFA